MAPVGGNSNRRVRNVPRERERVRGVGEVKMGLDIYSLELGLSSQLSPVPARPMTDSSRWSAPQLYISTVGSALPSRSFTLVP